MHGLKQRQKVDGSVTFFLRILSFSSLAVFARDRRLVAPRKKTKTERSEKKLRDGKLRPVGIRCTFKSICRESSGDWRIDFLESVNKSFFSRSNS